MGYYSKLFLCSEKIKTNMNDLQLRNFIEKCNTELETKIDIVDFEGIGNEFISIRRLEDGSLEIYYVDRYVKWRDTDSIAWVLKEIIDEGQLFMDFIGEDEYKWGYIIKDKKLIEYRYERIEDIIHDEILPIAKIKGGK